MLHDLPVDDIVFAKLSLCICSMPGFNESIFNLIRSLHTQENLIDVQVLITLRITITTLFVDRDFNSFGYYSLDIAT